MPGEAIDKRASNPNISRNRLARARVARHLPALSRWRSSIIRLRAVGTSHHHTAADAMHRDGELAAIQREVRLARQAFVLEMHDIGDTPAVIDYLRAVDSLS